MCSLLLALHPQKMHFRGARDMTDTDQEKEDEVLKRMLNTPHKKHQPTTPLGKRRREDRKKAER